MGRKTLIAWTDHTFNAVWGCVKVSAGCTHCYAEAFAVTRLGRNLWGPGSTRRTFGPKHWAEPALWDRLAEREGRRHRVFCGSMFDAFEDHPTVNAERERLWDVIRRTPHLDWQLLTKRPENIARFLPPDWGPDGYPNVWLGASVEDMRVASRVAHLVAIAAVVRFISYEPALGPLDDLDVAGLDWVIYGGESGPKHRQHDLAWPRMMRAKCEAAGVAYFFKQSAAPRTEMGTTLDGETVRAFPVPRVPATASLRSVRSIVTNG